MQPMVMLVDRHGMVYGKSPNPGYLEELDLKTIDEFKDIKFNYCLKYCDIYV